MREIIWSDDVEEEDYVHAKSYLGLVFTEDMARTLTGRLRKAEVTSLKAKNIVRASETVPLSRENIHIKENFKEIEAGNPLVPVLLVRDIDNRKLIIAEGWHRVCTAYHWSEDSEVRCKLV